MALRDPCTDPGSVRSMSTYVLVHGISHGGWCWRPLARLLRRAGHEVFTPTLTGLGERWHLVSADVNLDTHITDVVNVLMFEDLAEVILVGHSYGGMVVTGVADRALSRIGHLVFLDAAHPRNGESLRDTAPDFMDNVRKTTRIVNGAELMNAPPSLEFVELMGVTAPHDIKWMMERLTPHPWKCCEQALRLVNERLTRNIPYTNINASWSVKYLEPVFKQRALEGDRVWEIATGHDIMITEPEALAQMLLKLAG